MSDCKHTIALIDAAGARFYIVTHDAPDGGGVSILDADGEWIATASRLGYLGVSTRAQVRPELPPDRFHGDSDIANAATAIAECDGLHGLQIEVTDRPIVKGEL